MRKSIAQLYDACADTYEQNRGLFDMSAVFEAFFQRFTGTVGNLLDLGCGAGKPFAAAFIRRGWAERARDAGRAPMGNGSYRLCRRSYSVGRSLVERGT